MWGFLLRKRREIPEFLNVPWKIRDLALFVLGWFGIQVAVVIALKLASPYVVEIRHFLDAAVSGSDITAVFALNLLDAAVGLGLVYLFLRHYKVGWKSMGWRKVNVGKAIAYLALILVIFVIASNALLLLVSWLVPSFNVNQPQDNEFVNAAGSHFDLAVFALVLLPPVLEETIFRGFLFPALAKKWGVVWGAVISSAIFGIAHFQANISIYTFVLGLLLCFMYVRLRSIVPGIALHMLNNLLAFVAYTHK